MRPRWVLDRRRAPRRRPSRASGEGTARRLARACVGGITYPFTVRSELGSFSGDSRRPLQFGRRDADAIEAELYSHLTPVKRRLWLQRAMILLVRAAVLAAGIELLVAFLGFSAIHVPQQVVNVAMGIVGAVALFCILQQKVTFADAARVLDRRLGLDQVIGTGVELTQRGTETRMARLQVRRATDAVRRVESSEALRLGLPLRDLRAFLVMGVLTAAFLFLSTLNIAWPGEPPPSDAIAEVPIEQLAEAPYSGEYYEGEAGSTLDPELFSSQLDEYMSELSGQNLDPEEMAARMAEIQAQLAQRAEALNRQRQAMADLADALSDSSASSDAADSIRRGDYEKAASQLSELGKQSAQLSQRARRDLAQRLAEAAMRVQANNPDLANRMARAAQQMASGDQAGAEQALNELGEGVKQSGEQMSQLADSSSQYDPSQMDADQMAQSALSAEELGALSEFQGQGEGEMGSEGEGAGTEGSFGEAPGEGDGLGASGSSDQAGGENASTGAGAGSGPGRDQYQRPNAVPAAQQARVLELRGRPTDGGGSSTENDPRVPLVNSNDGSVAVTDAVGGRSVITEALSVRGEQNHVPWEKRQIVRDYFSGAGG